MADPTSISIDYVHIEHALKHQWLAFEELRKEINEFKPKPLEEFADSRAELLARFRKLNPDSDIEPLEVLADGQVRYSARDDVQFARNFERRMMTIHVTAAFLSHALCEALVNAILAVGLVERDIHDVFPMLERSDIKEKWRVGLKTFSPNYSLDTGTALYETLQRLTRSRNALTHHKIDLHVGNERILSGSAWLPESPAENLRWTERFFSLPFDLAKHALSYPNVSAMAAAVDRRPIPIAEAHRAVR